MLYIFMGQSCTGKSTIANKLKELIGAQVFSGKDYLRMAKNENEAWKLFYDKLKKAALSEENKESIIYIVAEKDQLKRLSSLEFAHRVKFTASLDVIKLRFAKRMNGNLHRTIEKMLEKQFAEWENADGDIVIDTTDDINAIEAARLIMSS